MLQGRNIKKEELIPIHNVQIRGNIMAVFTLLPWAAARVASLAGLLSGQNSIFQ